MVPIINFNTWFLNLLLRFLSKQVWFPRFALDCVISRFSGPTARQKTWVCAGSEVKVGLELKIGHGADCTGKWSETWFWFQIVKEAYPDHTQFEKNNPHYDPSSKEDNPKWSMVKTTIFPISWEETDGQRGRKKVCGVFRSRYRVQLLHSDEVTLALGIRTEHWQPCL